MGPSLFHPTFRQLSSYADSEQSTADRQGIGAHLGSCADCRARVERIRALDEAARTLPAPSLPADLWEQIVERRRTGDEVILPLQDPPSVANEPPLRRIAAAVVVLMAIAGTALLLPTSELQANRSELVFAPTAPQAGERVQVTYRAGSLLSGEDRLRLRARYLRVDDLPAPGIGRQTTVAELVRDGDGRFEATIQLPDSVVYGAFAVENMDGERVDSNERRLWELLVHGADGRPRFAALAQRQFDHQTRNWELSGENARHAAALYPDRVDAWFMLYMNDQASFTGSALDSVRTEAQARVVGFDRRFRARRDLDPVNELGIITRFVDEVGDTVRHRYWRERLLRESPNSLWGVQERFFEVASLAESDPHLALARLDAMWRKVETKSTRLLFVGLALGIADGSGDPAAIRLWADRLTQLDPEWNAGELFVRHPALRAAGMDRLRARLQALETVDDSVRPLERSIPEERLVRREEAGPVFATLGAALLESGGTAAALDTLDHAARLGWDAPLFRRIAGLRLQVGDTAGAAAPLALAAVDPMLGPTLADSAAVLLGSRFDARGWNRTLTHARREMERRVLAHATHERLPERIRLGTPEGQTTSLRALAAGRPTFVAFWYRYCPLSATQIPQLQRTAAMLKEQGYAVLTLTEAITPEFQGYLREHKLTMPIYTDPEKELEKALGQWGVPEYYVLDEEGNVRFGPLNSLTEVPAQMAVVSRTSR